VKLINYEAPHFAFFSNDRFLRGPPPIKNLIEIRSVFPGSKYSDGRNFPFMFSIHALCDKKHKNVTIGQTDAALTGTGFTAAKWSALGALDHP